jgi:predicted HAD superfamily phosphohydrolase
MFKSKPQYTSQDLNDAVTRLTKLTDLQERAERNMRLVPTEPRYKEAYERLTANVLSASRYLEHLQRITK